MRVAAALIATILFAIARRPPLPDAAERLHDPFDTTPFDDRNPRWCERYHHGHYRGHAVRLTPSRATDAACTAGEGAGSSSSCVDPGCDACAARAPSPCAKVGDPHGNAVIQTVRDYVGTRRAVTAQFLIERQLPVGESHVAIYAAMHPHCHSTVQAILVPDGVGMYHLNVAVMQHYIGGNRVLYRRCLSDPVERISPPIADHLALVEGHAYRWTLVTVLREDGELVVSSNLETSDGVQLGSGRYRFSDVAVRSWFGVAGGAARYAFGAQFSAADSPSGGAPSVLLLSFDGRSDGRSAPE
jgi:hypothetical protein